MLLCIDLPLQNTECSRQRCYHFSVNSIFNTEESCVRKRLLGSVFQWVISDCLKSGCLFTIFTPHCFDEMYIQTKSQVMLRISVETPRAHHRAASQGGASAACRQVRSELSVVTVSLQLLNINKIWKSTSVDSERTVSGESKGGKEHLTFQRGYLLTPLITNMAEVDFMGHEQAVTPHRNLSMTVVEFTRPLTFPGLQAPAFQMKTLLPHFGHRLSAWHGWSARCQEVRGNRWLFLSPSFPCINSAENKSEEEFNTIIMIVLRVYQ